MFTSLPRRSRAPLTVLLMALAASCLPGIRPPEVTPQGTLGLKNEARGQAFQGPFAVVFKSPQGETTDPSEVSMVFNRPMRPLELAGDESTPPARLEALDGAAAPRGNWRWLGTSALSFAPTEPLAEATRFRVSIPAGTRALDGSVLDKETSFEFSTPRPQLVRTEPGPGFDSLKPDSTIELLFDQPIGLGEIEKHVTLEVGPAKGKDRSITVKASYPKAETKARIRLAPTSRLPLDALVSLHIDPKLRGLSGPLAIEAGASKRPSFRTYGPLRVRAFDCWRETPNKKCSARESARLELTNRVRHRDLARFVAIEPPVKIAWGASAAARGDEDDWVSSVNVPARLEAARSYRLVVKPGLKDEFGQMLAQAQSFPLETDDEWPDFEVGLVGSVWDAGKEAPPAIPLASINTNELEVVAASFDEAGYARFMFDKASGREFRRLTYERVTGVPGAKQQRLSVAGAKNTRTLRTLDLAAMLQKPTDRGLYAFAVRGRGQRGPKDEVHTLAVTDLGISAKMSRFGSVVWVTSLASGKPVPNATVSIRRRSGDEAFSATTDKDGLVTIPADRYDPSGATQRPEDDGLVFARLGGDVSVRRVGDMLSPWRFVPLSDPSGRLDAMGFVFTDRGVYRPGETIRAKGLFRLPTPRGSSTPAGSEVEVQAFDPQGEVAFQKRMKLGEFGDFAVDVPIPASARFGTFEVRAELDRGGPANASNDEEPEGRNVASATAQLAAYKASEFKVSVEPDRPSYVRGDRATFVTRGDYLFGAPMKGGKTRVSVRRGPGYFDLPLGLKDGDPTYVWNDDAFYADRPERNPGASSLTQNEGELGAKGDFATPVVLALPEQHGTETLRAESEVEDLTRQTVSTEASAIVHPGEFYVALQTPKDTFVQEGTAISPNVLAVEPSGRKRSGAAVTLELVRRAWSTTLRAAGESGATTESRVVDEVVDKCSLTTREAPTGCSLTPKRGGYHLIRATSRDGRGNTMGASLGLYVLTSKEGDGAVSWTWTDSAVVELVADKTAYEVGDVATVLVKSPFTEADALITVERAGVYRTERRTLKGATPTLRVPITGDMGPNAFVGVHLLRGRTKERAKGGADVGAPAFRLGYAQLAIRPDDRRLKVTLTPSAKELRPGQEVEIDVAVTDRKGAPVRANATVYAVDEGVLMLTGYRTPDPLPRFAAPRSLAVFSLESREDMARIFRLSATAPGENKGAEGGGGGSMRADFRATAFFEPSVLVDRGRAKVRFKLPDGLTTYRLMAVVADSGDRFGFGESQVVTSRRLMLRPALPRFFRAGDFVDAGVVVTSKGMPKTDVDIDLDAQGLQVDGEVHRRISLEASGQAEVRFRMKPTQAGNAVLAFRAKTVAPLGETDALKLTKRVEIPTSLEAVALAGATETAAAEALGDLGAIRSDVGGLELGLASSALVGLDGAVRQVIEYPYGCTEQLASRLVPLVLAADLLPLVGAPAPPDAKRVVADTIAIVLKSQKGDGSFGYWSDSSTGDPWLTAYVTWTLFEAKSRGHVVPESALDLATVALRKIGRDAVGGDGAPPKRGPRGVTVAPPVAPTSRPLAGAEAAFAADVLAMMGAPDAALQTRLYEQRDKLPLFARALVAHAMVLSKSNTNGAALSLAQELLRDLDNHVRPTPTGAMVVSNHGDAYAPLLDSDARTTAIVLRALVAAEPRHPLATRLARGLIGSREGGAFRSTQEAGWALVALDGYRRAQEAGPTEFDARVFFGDTLLKEAHFSGPGAVTAMVPAQTLLAARGAGDRSANVTFQLVGTGRLFYEARLRYARRELPTDTLDRGFFVRKTVRSLKPEAIVDALRTMPTSSARVVAAGDLVLVDLHVVNPSPRTQVVIDDPLPAGFEALDARLQTTSSAAALVDRSDEGDRDDDDARSGGVAVERAPFHREVHDDKVLTFVEHMPAGIYHYRYLARATSRGTFLLPPTRAECMYTPEVFGRTAGQVLEVR